MNKKLPIRIVLLTTDDLFGCAILNHLLIEYPWLHVIAISRPPLIDIKADLLSPLKEYVYYNGVYCPKTYFPYLDSLTQKAPGPYKTFQQQLTANTITEIPAKMVKKHDFIEFLNDNEIELVLSVHFPVIIPDKILNATHLPMINIHPGVLPNYQGILCPVWAASHAEPLGASIHKITSIVDGGPLYGIIKADYSPEETIMLQHLSLYQKGIDYLAALIQKQGIDHLTTSKQDLSQSHYFRYPTIREIDRIGDHNGIFSLEKFNHYLKQKFGIGMPEKQMSKGINNSV